ncbi:MAG: anion permease [Deltaproteobacteria bacterium]|nr:anion permease [Deltaproteobacteria bacterium]
MATFLSGARVPPQSAYCGRQTGGSIGFLRYSVAVFPLVVVMLLAGYILLKYFFPVDIDRVEGAQGIVSKRLKALGKMTYSEYSVGAVLLVTILAWAFLGESFGLSSVALISVVAMFVLRLVRWKDVEENVNWGIILMYGGAIVLGSALDKSGAAKWMVSSLVANWTGGPWTVFALFSFLSILLTAAISNAAVIAILLPVSIGMAQSLSIDPVLLTYAIAVPAGLDFMFPMGTPAIAIAASSNYISIRDSVKGGFIMFVLAWLAFNLVAALWWPLIGMGY